MRNKYLVAVLLVCLVIALPAIASARTQYNCECRVFTTWTDSKDYYPTCQHGGEQYSYCDVCGTKSYRDIGPQSHSYSQ